LLLLSGLADGADRIAVRAALSLEIPYVAVLPMDAELYRDDFSPRSEAEFKGLLAGALRVVVMPLPHGVNEIDIAHAGDARDRQYDCLGQFLVNSSQILIAVWDHVRTRKLGGTGEVVALKLGEKHDGVSSSRGSVNGAGTGPVHILLARRQKTGPEVPTGTKHEVRYPDGTSAEDFEGSYKLLDQYNADVRDKRDNNTRKVVGSRCALCHGQEASGLTPAMEWVASVYSWADTLAIHFAARSLWLWRAVFVLLAIASAALSLLHTIPQLEDDWRPHVLYYSALALAVLLALLEVRDKRRQRHEDYRALAEALRVQFFWLAAGLRDMASENYLRRQAGEMTWIRDAMSESSLYNTAHAQSSAAAKGPRLSLARTWVEGQAAFFWKTSWKHRRKYRLFNSVALTLVGIGFLLPLVGWLVPLLTHQEMLHLKQLTHTLPTLAMLWAALAWNYSELRGYVQEARQYARMYDLFCSAKTRLEKFEGSATPDSFASADATIRELGQDALAENGDWLVLHRERKLKPGLAAG
jgi:hypothetical protein